MKKSLFAFLLFIAIQFNSFPQQNVQSEKNVAKIFTVGPEFGFPMGQFVRKTTIGYGFNTTFELGWTKSGFFFEAGYMHFPGSSTPYGTGTINYTYYDIPIVAGYKYYLPERVFVGVGLSINFFGEVRENPVTISGYTYSNKNTANYEKYGIVLESGWDYPIDEIISLNLTGRYLYLDKITGFGGLRAGVRLTFY